MCSLPNAPAHASAAAAAAYQQQADQVVRKARAEFLSRKLVVALAGGEGRDKLMEIFADSVTARRSARASVELLLGAAVANDDRAGGGHDRQQSYKAGRGAGFVGGGYYLGDDVAEAAAAAAEASAAAALGAAPAPRLSSAGTWHALSAGTPLST